MFIGHFGVGLGLKKPAAAVSLGTLFLAAQFIDLLWSTLLLLGIEHVELAPGASGPPLRFSDYPVSHSLIMVVIWAVLFGAAYLAWQRRVAAALLVAAAVVSHWFLDLIVRHPDLPLAPGAIGRYGLGLWASRSGSLLLEFLIFAAGLWLYCRTTQARDRIGRIGFWCLIGSLVLIQLGNVFGAPPPSVNAVAWVGEAQWLLVIWAYWIDGHRMARGTDAGRP